jgi:hypothetical protein
VVASDKAMAAAAAEYWKIFMVTALLRVGTEIAVARRSLRR